MGELTKAQITVIDTVLSGILDEYAANNQIIFRSNGERVGRHFSAISQHLKDWKRSQICMVPKCNKRTIKRAHTLPKELSLASISEDRHLLTPEFDHKSGKVMLKIIGVNLASTFPGFCTEHEALFQEFEGTGEIIHERHVYLQAYRTACGEQFRAEFVIKQHDRMVSIYNTLRDQRLEELVVEKLRARGFADDFEIKKLRVSIDPHEEEWKGRIDSAREHSEQFTNYILPAFEKAIFDGDPSDVYLNAIEIDLQVPVALSGAAVFYVDDNGTNRRVTPLINIIPSNGKSLLILGSHNSDKRYIETYISTWMRNAFKMISMIESWMVNGTDQWYLMPSVWEALPKKRQDAIISAMYACKQNIGEEFELSIFDKLRNHLLELLAAKEYPKNEEYHRFVKAQLAKMI